MASDVLSFRFPYIAVGLGLVPTSIPWNDDLSPRNWISKPWGPGATGAGPPVGAYLTSTWLYKQKMDIRGLTIVQEKTLFPYGADVTYGCNAEWDQPTGGTTPWFLLDYLVVSRVPIAEETLARIVTNIDSHQGGIPPGMRGSGMDEEDVLYYSNFKWANVHDGSNVGWMWPQVGVEQHSFGSMTPTAGPFLYSYRIVTMSMVGAGWEEQAIVFVPPCTVKMAVDDEKEDNMPWLARRLHSEKNPVAVGKHS